LLSKEFERTIASSEVDIRFCMIRLMLRRLTHRADAEDFL
jgi:hypothetical protein